MAQPADGRAGRAGLPGGRLRAHARALRAARARVGLCRRLQVHTHTHTLKRVYVCIHVNLLYKQYVNRK